MSSSHLRLKKKTQGQFLLFPWVWGNNDLTWGVEGAKELQGCDGKTNFSLIIFFLKIRKSDPFDEKINTHSHTPTHTRKSNPIESFKWMSRKSPIFKEVYSEGA